MIYYSIPDLHGRFDLLLKAIELIDLDANRPVKDYQIITTGDYIDRGPDSKKIIDYLIANDRIKALKGNHEDMMHQSITTPLHPDWWIGNGGDATLKSYGWGGEPYYQISYEVVPKAHLDWINELPLFYETEKQVFVHAGIPQKEMNLPPKNDRLKEEMIWMLYDKHTTGGWKGKHVVHGHDQFADGPHTWHGPYGGRTDLDTWAYHTGRLAIGVFDDTQGPPIRILEVRGDDYNDGQTYS